MKRFGALLALSILAAIVGLGLGSERSFVPRELPPETQGVSPDGWIVNGAKLNLRELAPIGNRLVVDFMPRSPAQGGPTAFKVNVCGEQAAEFQAISGPQPISLKGDCSPRTVEFVVLNPFVPSSTDQRELGSQIRGFEISSRLGFPIVSAGKVMLTLIAILILAIAVALAIDWRVGVFTPVLAGFVLASINPEYIVPLKSLWFFVVPLLLGGAIYRRYKVQANVEPIGAGLGLALCLVVIAAGVFRFYGISFGLPANYHPDEVPKVNAIMRMYEAGDLNPRYFLHPSWLLYSTYGVNKIMHLVGVDGSFRDTAFLAGRIVSALAGTGSVLMLALVAARLFSPIVGLLSATLLAVYPLHLTGSRYLKEDSLLVFMILMTVWLVVKAAQEDRWLLLLLAGLFAGFTASTKYTGILSVMIIVGAPWIKSKSWFPDRRYLGWSVLALCLVPIGFVSLTPYSILDRVQFLKDFGHEQAHMKRGHTILVDAWSQLWMYHYGRSIVPGTTLIGAIVGVAGLGLLLWRRRIEDLYLVALFLLFYLPAEFVKAKPEPQPERYIFPCLPFLAVAAAELMRVVSVGRGRGVAIALSLILITSAMIRSGEITSEISDDTRAQLSRWMVENIPHGSTVLIDWKPYSVSFPNKEITIEYLPRSKIIPALQIAELKKTGADYLVLSSLFYGRYFTQPKGEPALREVLRTVFRRLPIINEFSPKFGTYGFHNPTVTLFSLRDEDLSRFADEMNEKQQGKIEHTQNETRWSYQFTVEGKRKS